MPKSIHSSEYTKLIRKLVAERERRGLTQAALAIQIGTTQSIISKIERRERRLDLVEFRKGRSCARYVGGSFDRRSGSSREEAMSFVSDLQEQFEEEEIRTVGTSFGGTVASQGSYSVVRIRDWILENFEDHGGATPECLSDLKAQLPKTVFRGVVAAALRFSFLIELTDLKVGSTKMKTRWRPGHILMPQQGSFCNLSRAFSSLEMTHDLQRLRIVSLYFEKYCGSHRS